MGLHPAPVIAFGLASLAVFSSPADAQQRNNAGLGTIKRKFNATEQTGIGDNILAGVGHLNGKLYVSGGGAGGAGVPTIYEFDMQGNLLGTFQDPSLGLGGANIFDLANDGTSLFGGSSVGVVVFDATGNLVTQVQANNGAQTIVNPIAGPGLLTIGTFRAVEFDRAGNGGNGSLFVGNTGAADPILEIDLAGNVLNTFANNATWTCSGLALDLVTNNLWCNTGPPDANGDFCTILELDRSNNLVPTGNQFAQMRKGPFQGSVEKLPLDSDSDPYPSHFDLVVLSRLNGEDSVVTHRVHVMGRSRLHICCSPLALIS